MIPSKNIPLFLNLVYSGFNRGLPGKGGEFGDFQPIFNSDGTVKTTFCNQFINYVLQGLGYFDMNGMLANEMVAFMEDVKNGWISVNDEIAQFHANNGVIVIAGHSVLDAHGHVCFILPGILEKSHTWGKAVPKCASIGKDVFLGKKVSFAFRAEEMPQYFCLAKQI